MINRSMAAKSVNSTSVYGGPQLSSKKYNLTANQKMVYETLLNLGRSAGAYEVLDLLRKKGVNAAATVYRALNELTKKGLVQRIVSTRTFVARENPRSASEDSLLLICEDSGEVTEVKDEHIAEVFDRIIAESGYRVNSYHLELMVSGDSGIRKG